MVQARAHRRLAFVAAAVLGAVVGLTGCTHELNSAPAAGGTPKPAAPAPVRAVELTVTPAAGAPLAPGRAVRIAAAHGTLTSVTFAAADGTRLAGQLASDGSSWASTTSLPAGATLTWTARTIDAAGTPRTEHGTVRTIKPTAELTTAISPLSGRTVGVGMPIVVRFSNPVTDRSAVQAALTVHASDSVEGSWSWVSDTEVHYRPRTFWPAHTRVTLDVALAGVDAGKGVYGAKDRTVAFDIGASMVSRVDVKAHRMTVTRDGHLIRTIKVTTGKDGFLTRNGTKVILEKYEHKIMDSTTVGIRKGSKEYYRLDVPYAMRVTWSGEFVHAAPWSERKQGLVNVSHGCVGMSLDDGKWMFEQSQIGDVVIVVNSPRQLEAGNGYTDWNVPWSTWVAGSATS